MENITPESVAKRYGIKCKDAAERLSKDMIYMASKWPLADPKKISDDYWAVCTKVDDLERFCFTVGKKYQVINEGFPTVYGDNGNRLRLYSTNSNFRVAQEVK